MSTGACRPRVQLISGLRAPTENRPQHRHRDPNSTPFHPPGSGAAGCETDIISAVDRARARAAATGVVLDHSRPPVQNHPGLEGVIRRFVPFFAIVGLALGVTSLPRHIDSRVAGISDFVHFESGQAHPAALTPSGTRLLVVNTPNDRLAIFDVTGPRPVLTYDLPVGLEPVAVAARSDSEAWVVNQLSDDVSIVNLNTRHVRGTLRVGDEPSDVVFANGNAYVSVSQYDQVRVYDAGTLALVATKVLEDAPGSYAMLRLGSSKTARA